MQSGRGMSARWRLSRSHTFRTEPGLILQHPGSPFLRGGEQVMADTHICFTPQERRSRPTLLRLGQRASQPWKMRPGTSSRHGIRAEGQVRSLCKFGRVSRWATRALRPVGLSHADSLFQARRVRGPGLWPENWRTLSPGTEWSSTASPQDAVRRWRSRSPSCSSH